MAMYPFSTAQRAQPQMTFKSARPANPLPRPTFNSAGAAQRRLQKMQGMSKPKPPSQAF